MNKGRKITSGKYMKRRKKKLNELQGQKKVVKLGEEKKKSNRVRGGNIKTFFLRTNSINVNSSGKSEKLGIKNVVETPSNRFLARQNVITKGTIVETDKGRVRVTSRPTQSGSLNGILVS